MSSLSIDAGRTARLWCGEAAPADAQVDGWPRSAHVSARRPRGLRALLALRTGRCDHASIAVEPAVALRRAVLGGAAEGPPRILLRVDEFPIAGSRDDPALLGTASFARVHDVLAAAGVPYLVAVLPRVARDYLTPGPDEGDELDAGEVAMLERLRSDGVTFALHAHTHRTRDIRPRHRSATAGIEPAVLDAILDRAEATLGALGIRPRVFVPPFNRFDATQYAVLARRYDVVCGGPESASVMGLTPSPCWIGDGVYLPSYPPLYGRSATMTGAIDRLAGVRSAVWLPVTVHPGWELADDLKSLARFAARIAPLTRPWDEFLTAVDATR